MDLTTQNVIAWHRRTPADHWENVNHWVPLGFRTLSLTLYGTTANPLLAAVMVKRPAPVDTRQFGPVTQAGIQQNFDDMVKQGYGPYILTATGPPGSPLFSGVFKPMNSIPLTRLNLTAAQLVELNNQQRLKGNILLWADAFGTPQDTRYTAIWGPSPGKPAWNCDAIDEPAAALQARFLAITSTWGRPAHVAVTPAGRHLELFVDSTIGAWSMAVGLSSDSYQTEFDKAAKAGLLPIRVSASGSGAGAKFAAVFADRDHVDQRVFRAKGPVTVPAIDAAMEKYVRDTDLRGVSLAITLGARLVYAKGYTFAEPAPIYPDVLPTTLYRQASVSKMFAAVAIWRLMQQKPGFTLDTTLQSVLNLKQPNDTDPKDSHYKDIKIRHLLESTSGLPQGLLFGSVNAAQAFGADLPATPAQLARLGTTFDLMGTPGTKSAVAYGNYDYFMLSQVAAKLAGTSTFEQALKTLVLTPLSMTRTRGSRSLVGDQGPGEARHHMRVYDPASGWKLFPMEVGASVRSPSKPTVPTHYGAFDWEMFDGSGGLSSAVIDVARVAAMFSDRSANPVLSAASIDALFVNAAAATNKFLDHGYHGFDGASVQNTANHVYAASKGGWLPGQGTVIRFITGGFGYAIAQNGNPAKGSNTDWGTPVSAATKAHPWSGDDLFPQFGMPSLEPSFLQAAMEVAAQPVPVRVEDTVRESVSRQLSDAQALGYITLRPGSDQPD
jgi:CubicO group peptidase (beta-lactamase class C family)